MIKKEAGDFAGGIFMERTRRNSLLSADWRGNFLDRGPSERYNMDAGNPKLTAGPSSPHKTVGVLEKPVEALRGKASKPTKIHVLKQISVPKPLIEKKSHRVLENPILRAVIAGFPGHSIACTLIPLAVLKLKKGKRTVFLRGKLHAP